jgi:repressor LexA
MSRQQVILAFILEHNKAKGYSPTLREIGDGIGLKSPSSVHRYLKALEKQGLIKRLNGSARAIEVIMDRNTLSEVQVLEYRDEIQNVIQWQGRRYVYDPLG